MIKMIISTFLLMIGIVSVNAQVNYQEKDEIGNYIIVKKANKWGLVDKAHKIIEPISYNKKPTIISLSSDVSIIKFPNKCVVLNLSEGVISETKFKIYEKNRNGLILLDEKGNGEWWKDRKGIMNNKGEIILPVKYYEIFEVENGFWVQKKWNSKKLGNTFMIDTEGNTIKQLKYTDIEKINTNISNLYIIQQNGKYEIVNSKGEAVSSSFDCINDITNNCKSFGKYITFLENKKWGYIDISVGDDKIKRITEAKYDEVNEFYNEVAVIKINEKYGMIDRSGSTSVEIIYQKIMDCRDVRLKVSTLKGEIKIYAYGQLELNNSDEMLVCVKKDEKWSIINQNGEVLKKTNYKGEELYLAFYYNGNNGNKDYISAFDENGNVLGTFKIAELINE